jgi:hypothetical protein
VDLSGYATKTEVNSALGGKQDTLTAGANITISGKTISAKDTTYSAGTGISLSGTTINHSNSVTANTSGVGSSTKVPIIKYDDQGHITSISTATIYPPTSAGTSGQYWKSDGSGTGVWQSLDTSPKADSTNAITSGAVKSALDGKLATNGTAAKATADASGNNIANTYAKKTEIPDVSGFETKANAITGLSVSGRTITYTKGDGSTGTITTQDNNSDTKVRQVLQTGNYNLPLLLSYQVNTNTTANVDNVCYRNNSMYANPSTGVITAPGFAGPLTGNVTGNCSGSSGSCTGNAETATQFSANKSVALTGDVTGSASSKAGWSVATTLAASGVTAGSYGPSANASPAHKGTFSVPYFTVDAKGRVTAASTMTITLPADNNTTYSNMTAATASAAGKAGLVPAPAAGAQGKYLRGDGTWQTPTNTTYSNMSAATADAAGKAGLVPAPAAGAQGKFLRGDGTWQTPTNTTYSVATTSANGLMSSSDKSKLDGIATGANKTTVDNALSSTSTNPVQNKVVNSALAGKQATLTAGSNITISGTTISATNTTYGVATTSANGLMSSSDKSKLNGLPSKITISTADPSGGSNGDIWFKYA